MKFRFTIRDLLWLTLVVAICCSYWTAYARAAAKRHERTQCIGRLKQLVLVQPLSTSSNVDH